MPDTIIVTPSSPISVTVTPAATPVTPPTEVAVYEGQPGPPGPQGIQGPAGPTGATGPQGPAGVTPTIAFTYTQNTVSSTWNITHNLGFYPNVATIDSAGTNIEGTISYTSLNALVISFSISTSGIAYLS